MSNPSFFTVLSCSSSRSPSQKGLAINLCKLHVMEGMRRESAPKSADFDHGFPAPEVQLTNSQNAARKELREELKTVIS